jgi:hypothetical protein
MHPPLSSSLSPKLCKLIALSRDSGRLRALRHSKWEGSTHCFFLKDCCALPDQMSFVLTFPWRRFVLAMRDRHALASFNCWRGRSTAGPFHQPTSRWKRDQPIFRKAGPFLDAPACIGGRMSAFKAPLHPAPAFGQSSRSAGTEPRRWQACQASRQFRPAQS